MFAHFCDRKMLFDENENGKSNRKGTTFLWRFKIGKRGKQQLTKLSRSIASILRTDLPRLTKDADRRIQREKMYRACMCIVRERTAPTSDRREEKNCKHENNMLATIQFNRRNMCSRAGCVNFVYLFLPI